MTGAGQGTTDLSAFDVRVSAVIGETGISGIQFRSSRVIPT